MLKIGIIGVGNIADCHIKAYQNNPNVEIYAFCDLHEERLKSKGETYGVTRLYTDLEEMLALPELDAVSVCTWNSAHAPCTIAALNAGKHVLCEKPAAMNAEEAQEMADAAKKSGKLLMIGFVRRFGNDMNVLQDFIADDFFGEFYYGKAIYVRRNGAPGGWFGDKSRSGGGPLIDLGVHVIDYARYAMGNPNPVSVYGVTYHKLGNRNEVKTSRAYLASDNGRSEDSVYNVEDLASALIRFDNGATLNVEVSFALNIPQDRCAIELFGPKGGVVSENELKLYSVASGYLSDVTLQADTTAQFDMIFQNEIDHYVDCLLGKTECRSTADDGVQMMKILDAIYESASTGHEVVIEG